MVAGHGVGAPMVDRLDPGGEQPFSHQVTRAADAADLDPDRISFTRVLRIARRTATGTANFSLRTGTTS